MSGEMELESLHQATASPVEQSPAESPRSTEGTSLLGKDSCTQEQLRKLALASSWITIIINILTGLSTFIYSLIDDSDAGFAFGLDAILDVASLVVIIWRFYSSEEVRSLKREKIACILIGALFILSSLVIVFKSVFDIIVNNRPTKSIFLFVVAAVNSMVFSILAILKFSVGKRLKSPSLIADGFNSLLSVVMSVGIMISSGVEEFDPQIWYIDAITGLLVGFVILAYGARLIYQSLFPTSQPTAQPNND